MSLDPFKIVFKTMCLQIIYNIYVYRGFGNIKPTMVDMP